jgi:hypothetical protein
MKRAVAAALVYLAAHALACGLDWSVPPDAAADAGALDASADDGKPPTPEAGVAVGDAGDDRGPGPDVDTGVPTICNGNVCKPDEICAYLFRDCGEDPKTKVCVPRSTFCGTSKVCGCDAVVYDNECAAAAAGTTAGPTSLCNPPGDTFDCAGIRYCSDVTETCASRLPQTALAQCVSRGSCDDCGCLSVNYCQNDAGSCSGLQYLSCSSAN